MSVIGPRPISAEEIEWFGNDAALYLSVPGGITGLWQSGLRNEASFENGERQRVELSRCSAMVIPPSIDVILRVL